MRDNSRIIPAAVMTFLGNTAWRQGVIDGGNLWQQTFVITLLRITPFAPFRCCRLPASEK